MSIFLLLAVVTGHAASRAVNISTTWTLPQEGFPHFFRYFKDPATWDDATIICDSFQAELLTVETDERRDAIRAYLKELDVIEHSWLGLQRTSPDSPFIWTGGGQGPLVGDGFWQESNPQTPEKLCVAIDPIYDLRWESEACDMGVFPFVCQMPVPDWAKGDGGCLLHSLPSLTVTYLPDMKTIQLLSDCGLSGTKRIACKGDENQAELMKRLSCDGVEESTTQAWSDKVTHGFEHKSTTTTVSDWVSGATSRSWGTRHKRESGGTSTSTDTSLVQRDETSPTMNDTQTSHVTNNSTESNGQPVVRNAYSTPKIPTDDWELVDLEQKENVDESFKDTLLESVPLIHETHNSSEQLTPGNYPVVVMGTMENVKAPVEEESVIQLIERPLSPPSNNENEDSNTSETAWSKDSNSLPTTHHPTVSSTIRTITTENSVTSTRLIIPHNEVSYQINPPLTLRKGGMAVKKETFQSQDVIDLNARTENEVQEQIVETSQTEKENDELSIKPVIYSMEIIVDPEKNQSMTTQSQNELPTTTYLPDVMFDRVEQPQILHEIVSDVYYVGSVKREMLKEDKSTITKGKTSDTKVAKNESEEAMTQIDIGNDVPVDFGPVSSQPQSYLVFNDERPSTEQTNPSTTNPLEVEATTTEKSNENDQLESGDSAYQQSAKTMHPSQEVELIQSTSVAPLIDSKSTAVTEAVPRSSQPTATDAGPLEPNTALHEDVEELRFMRIMDPIAPNALNRTKLDGKPFEEVNINDHTGPVENTPNTNEPDDTKPFTTPHMEKAMRATTRDPEFRGGDDDVDDSPKRPIRSRVFPHSNPLSFYPYFINRVLG